MFARVAIAEGHIAELDTGGRGLGGGGGGRRLVRGFCGDDGVEAFEHSAGVFHGSGKIRQDGEGLQEPHDHDHQRDGLGGADFTAHRQHRDGADQ
ncbi:Uncharacterised protein [Mycobacteroides abscessus subsp. abscessus]|nr:Uncharacterised protein [Mycobacteroides abscessus subsp. abscessus]